MNYGKFRFEQNKKAQQAKKKQKQQQVKEIKLRPGTEENDYQTKLTNLKRLNFSEIFITSIFKFC